MCGHVGIAGKLETKDESTMKRLLVFDYFRGPDSTGFAALRSNSTKDIHIVKLASNPIDLFQMKKFDTALNGFNSTVFLGHNRLATKGVVNNYNAHPYQFDKADGSGVIVGAHNGTLDASSWKELEEELGEKYEVDSMAVIAAIAKFGIEKTIPMLRGAWALVWFDTSDNSLNFIRNKERPFWYAYSKKFDKLFWASEYPIIRAALGLSTAPYELFEHDGYCFWETEEDWWYKFDLEALKNGATERPKPRVKVLKGKEPVQAAYSYRSGDPFQHSGTTCSTTRSRGTTGAVTDNTEKKEVVHSHLHITGTSVKPFGDFVTKEEFDRIAKYGCSWCQADVDYEEAGVEVYIQQDMILCPTCADSNGNSRAYVEASRMVC